MISHLIVVGCSIGLVALAARGVGHLIFLYVNRPEPDSPVPCCRCGRRQAVRMNCRKCGEPLCVLCGPECYRPDCGL